jgi:hypothetical protein
MDALGRWQDVKVAGHERALLVKWPGFSVVFTSDDIVSLPGQLYYGASGVVGYICVFPWAIDSVLNAQVVR